LPLPRFVDYSLRFIAPISLSLAIYYHYQSVQERLPTFYVSPSRARIVDTSVSTPAQLQVLYRGKDLAANVNAVILYFWNNGKLPIKAEDVLEPLKVELEPGSEIIDARVLRLSRGVTNFAKGEVSDTARNVLPLSFRILERSDGAALQIIYTGKPNAHIAMTGIIVGANQPQEIAPPAGSGSAKEAEKQMKMLAFAVALTGAFAIFLMPLINRLFTRLLKLLGLRTDLLSERLSVVIMTLAFVVASGIFVLNFSIDQGEDLIPSAIHTLQR